MTSIETMHCLSAALLSPFRNNGYPMREFPNPRCLFSSLKLRINRLVIVLRSGIYVRYDDMGLSAYLLSYEGIAGSASADALNYFSSTAAGSAIHAVFPAGAVAIGAKCFTGARRVGWRLVARIQLLVVCHDRLRCGMRCRVDLCSKRNSCLTTGRRQVPRVARAGPRHAPSGTWRRSSANGRALALERGIKQRDTRPERSTQMVQCDIEDVEIAQATAGQCFDVHRPVEQQWHDLLGQSAV